MRHMFWFYNNQSEQISRYWDYWLVTVLSIPYNTMKSSVYNPSMEMHYTMNRSLCLCVLQRMILYYDSYNLSNMSYWELWLSHRHSGWCRVYYHRQSERSLLYLYCYSSYYYSYNLLTRWRWSRQQWDYLTLLWSYTHHLCWMLYDRRMYDSHYRR